MYQNKNKKVPEKQTSKTPQHQQNHSTEKAGKKKKKKTQLDTKVYKIS